VSTRAEDDAAPPEAAAFLDARGMPQAGDGRVQPLAVAVCDDAGRARRRFAQGEVARFVLELAVHHDIEVPAFGLTLRTLEGILVHGKNTLHYRTPVPRRLRAGTVVTAHHRVPLDLGLGSYTVSLGFASTDESTYERYLAGRLDGGALDQGVRRHCWLETGVVITVTTDANGLVRHSGYADLRGSWETSEVAHPAPHRQSGPRFEGEPVRVLVSHPHGGGEWLGRVLGAYAPDRVAPPHPSGVPFRLWGFRPGALHLDAAVSREAFDEARLSSVSRLVMVRDLRDTLVAAYLHLVGVHGPGGEAATGLVLRSLDKEDALLYLMDQWLPPCAAFQLSWRDAGEAVVRYEDLRESREALARALERLQLRPTPSELDAAVAAASAAPIGADEPGGWRGSFSPRVAAAFEHRYGEVLRAFGYERERTWSGAAVLARRAPDATPARLVYVSSYPRSGNTWLRNLIVHSLGRRVPSLYAEAADNLPPEADAADGRAFLTYALSAPAGGHARALRNGVGRLFDEALRRGLARSFEPRFVKTHDLPYAAFVPGEAVVHAVRHPCAVFSSYQHYLRDFAAPGAPAPTLEDVIRGDVAFGSWSTHTARWLDAAAGLGDAFVLVRYEELAARPEEVCARIAALTGLPQLASAASFPPFEEWQRRSPAFYRSGQGERWRSEFTPDHLSLVQDLHGETMARLGYSI
jgi:hypothetical protein